MKIVKFVRYSFGNMLVAWPEEERGADIEVHLSELLNDEWEIKGSGGSDEYGFVILVRDYSDELD